MSPSLGTSQTGATLDSMPRSMGQSDTTRLLLDDIPDSCSNSIVERGDGEYDGEHENEGYGHSNPTYLVHLTKLAATRGTAPKHDSTSSPTVLCFAYLTTTKALAVPGYALRKLFHRQLPIKRPAAEKNVAWWRNALLVKHVRYTSGVGPGQAHMSGHPAHHSSGS